MAYRQEWVQISVGGGDIHSRVRFTGGSITLIKFMFEIQAMCILWAASH